MTDHDQGLIDKLKNMLGMGGPEAEAEADDDRRTESGVPADRPMDDRSDTWGVDGAAQATGREGATGGTGASAGMGGAGAAGPIGADPDPSLDATAGSGAGTGRVDAGAVRTEYEMGHELDPDHETRAESGVLEGTTDDEDDARSDRPRA